MEILKKVCLILSTLSAKMEALSCFFICHTRAAVSYKFQDALFTLLQHAPLNPPAAKENPIFFCARKDWAAQGLLIKFISIFEELNKPAKMREKKESNGRLLCSFISSCADRDSSNAEERQNKAKTLARAGRHKAQWVRPVSALIV